MCRPRPTARPLRMPAAPSPATRCPTTTCASPPCRARCARVSCASSCKAGTVGSRCGLGLWWCATSRRRLRGIPRAHRHRRHPRRRHPRRRRSPTHRSVRTSSAASLFTRARRARSASPCPSGASRRGSTPAHRACARPISAAPCASDGRASRAARTLRTLRRAHRCRAAQRLSVRTYTPAQSVLISAHVRRRPRRHRRRRHRRRHRRQA